MSSPVHSSDATCIEAPALTPRQAAQLQREVVALRRQVAWFKRQIFGRKSERRLPEPERVQDTLGESFDAMPDIAPPAWHLCDPEVRAPRDQAARRAGTVVPTSTGERD